MKNALLFLLIICLTGAAFAQNNVRWIVSGGVTPTSAVLRAKMTNSSTTIRAVLSTASDFSAAPIYTAYATADTSNNLMAALKAEGLQEDTRYYYRIEDNGVADTDADATGTFLTTKYGPYNFKFMVGSCNRFPETNTYLDFKGYNPLFYLNCGDLHYEDPCDVDVSYHRSPYETNVFNWPNQAEVFRSMSFVYTWDDHDYCGNDANSANLPGTSSARKAYREYIPSHQLTNNSSIYHSFEVGRVLFIVTDLRSERVEGTTAMGATQKAWFKQQVLNARNRNLLTCWVSSYSWYGILNDNWGGETAERRELSEFFRDSSITNMFIVNGDAHMFAIDNGSNGDFTTAQNLPYEYPLMQAGPIQGSGSWKGGTYSQGQFYQFFVTLAQYGMVEVTDNGGDSVCVTMSGYKKDLNDGFTEQLVSYNFCRSLGPVISSISDSKATDIKAEVFPNPTNGTLYIRCPETNIKQLKLYSVDGMEITSSSSFNAGTVCKLSLTGMQPGMYIIQLQTDEGTLVSKKVAYVNQ